MDIGVKISKATKRNWERLNLTEEEIALKLTSRANKSFSKKHIIPKEYFSDKSNIKIVKNLLEYISQKNISIENAIYNLVINHLLKYKLITIKDNKIDSSNKHLKKILSEFKKNKLNKELLNFNLPNNEIDILGIIYQCLMQEGSKNKKGSYYTPQKIIQDFLQYIKKDTILLDPCCGTGSFLISLGDKIKNPENIYGVELDKISSFIAKINLIVKYKNIDFEPNIYNMDFLENDIIKILKDKNINLIATNPPWGTKYDKNYSENFPQIFSKELYSYFIVQAEKILSKTGLCCLILPESILNIGVHKDIRKFILDNFNILEINPLGKIFNGVLSDIVSMKLSKNFNTKGLDKTKFLSNKNYVFNITDNISQEIIDFIFSQKYMTLKNSKWGLGIVTGNNTKHIKKDFKIGEKIYRGKNIEKYFISDNDEYIEYKRENFQQAAPDEIYRAKEKLIYKFISKDLVFGYDNKQRLVLNSANILIPTIETHTIKTVLAFLNSKLFNFIYKNKFNALKVIKGNLLQLPFPALSENNRNLLENHVNNYLKNKNKTDLDMIDNLVYKSFKLPEQYVKIIQNY